MYINVTMQIFGEVVSNNLFSIQYNTNFKFPGTGTTHGPLFSAKDKLNNTFNLVHML